MKRNILLTVLLLQFTNVFSQTEFGSWVTSPCYDYIQTQMKFNGKSSYQNGTQRISQGWYSIKIKNNSNARFKLKYITTVNSNREVWVYNKSNNTFKLEKQSGLVAPEITLNPNEEVIEEIYLDNTFQKIIYFEVWSIQVESPNGVSISKYYEKCDNGNPCAECEQNPNQIPCDYQSNVSESNNHKTKTETINIDDKIRTLKTRRKELCNRVANDYATFNNYCTAWSMENISKEKAVEILNYEIKNLEIILKIDN